jgi:hypothetical protein
MDQKRKTHRYFLSGEVIGNFANNEKFVLNNLSVEGLQLASNFSPLIGSRYTLKLNHNKEDREFQFQVTHVETGNYKTIEGGAMPLGVQFNVGGKLLNMDDEKRKFIMSILLNR